MNLLQLKIQRIREEMVKGQGGEKVYTYPVYLEPLYEPFRYGVKTPSILEKLFQGQTNKPIVRSVNPTPLICIHIKPSIEDKGDLKMTDQTLSALHLHSPASFEIIGNCNSIAIQITVHPEDTSGVIGVISSCYPQVEAFEGEDVLKKTFEKPSPLIYAYRLKESYFFPLHNEKRGSDPYTTLFGILSGLHEEEIGALQVLFLPVQHDWRSNILQASRSEYDPTASPFYDLPQLPKVAEEKTQSQLFCCSVRLIGSSLQVVHRLERFFNQFNKTNHLIRISQALPPDSIFGRTNHATGIILNAQELACLVHMPSPDAIIPSVLIASPSAPPPKLATQNNLVTLGINHHRGVDTTVGISSEWLSRHMVICGQTGVGKTTLLKRFLSLVSKGYGLAFIDPNGDAAEEFLTLIPSHRVEDTIYFHPADPMYAPALNILQHSDRREAELICSDLVTAFERFYGNYWGPQTEMILRQCLRTLLLTPGEKYLPDVRRLLLDENYRKQLTKTIADPDLLDFWQLQFPRLPKNACNSFLNKLSKFLDNHLIRPVISQPNRIDFQTIMEKGMVFIANLSKGLLGEDNAYLLGSFLLSKFQILTMSRASLPREKRKLFPIIVDELHNYAETKANAKSLNSFFSEARKYNIPFIGATQYLDQLHESIRNAIFGTVGTLVIFRCGVTDSLILKREIGRFQEQDILNLGVGEALVRMGRASDTFMIKVTDTPIPQSHNKQKIIQDSYKKYYKLRTEVAKPQRAYTLPGDFQERTETRINPSPAEQTFLDCVHNHPTHSVTRIYAELKLSGYTGDKLKKGLIQQEYIKEITTHLGQRSRIAKFLLLTQKGFNALGINYSSEDGKGGTLHRYWQTVIKMHAESKGYEVFVEEPISGSNETVDLGLNQNSKRTAAEISVTSPAEHEVNNIKKCLNSSYYKVITLTLDEEKMLEIQNLMRKVLSTEEQAKVTTGLIYDFDRFF